MARWFLLSLAWLVATFPGSARALDDTGPGLRFGGSVGAVGSLPLGDTKASGAQDDEATPALWLVLEPLSFELRDRWVIAPFAQFRVAGGVNENQVERALSPVRRVDPATGKELSGPDATMLQLGVKGRHLLFPGSRLRPYISLGLAFATQGARYEATPAVSAAPTSGMGSPVGGGGGTEARLHRHRGIGVPLGLGIRFDQPIVVFDTPMRLPIALELAYTHNFWLELQRKLSIETSSGQLVGKKPMLDYLSLVITVGFLR